jgi:arginyl-tRNA synthetase
MAQQRLAQLVSDALAALGIAEPLPFKVDSSPRQEFGDYAVNAAIIGAKKYSRDPLELAAELSAKIKELDNGQLIAKLDVVKPGFINIFLKDHYLQQNLPQVIEQDHRYGARNEGRGEKVLLEYVSANPTGPLHVGHGRWAVVGDVIARLLRADGWSVTTEYYVNNVGNQVDKLWLSVQAARAGQPIPEGGYGGVYIKDVSGNSKEEALTSILAGQKTVLAQTGVTFDNFFFENTLHDAGQVRGAVKKLAEMGKTKVEGGDRKSVV